MRLAGDRVTSTQRMRAVKLAAAERQLDLTEQALSNLLALLPYAVYRQPRQTVVIPEQRTHSHPQEMLLDEKQHRAEAARLARQRLGLRPR